MRSALVNALRLACEADRAFHGLLSACGYRRKFHGSKGQDRWVLERASDWHRGGYFVEVGGADGRTHSNTYILERDYGWTGVVIEANPSYIPALRSNRKCHCVHACVDGRPSDVDFFCFGFMGGIIGDDTDNARDKRGSLIGHYRANVAKMRGIPLHHILESVDAPLAIDYLSIDVEGAEHRILRGFPFDRYKFASLTIERPTRAIHALLQNAGYVLDRTHRYDGFYVSADRAVELKIKEHPFGGMAPKSF